MTNTRVQHWIDGDLNIGQIKDVKIEDLLGREQISIANTALIDEYENQIIFIKVLRKIQTTGIQVC